MTATIQRPLVLPTASLDDLLRWGPCWLRDGREGQLYNLAATQERWTAEDVLRLEVVPPEDRLWVVLRRQLLPDWVLRLFAADCAVRTLVREREAGREPDPRSWRAVEVARDLALGKATDEQRREAREEAWLAYDVAWRNYCAAETAAAEAAAAAEAVVAEAAAAEAEAVVAEAAAVAAAAVAAEAEAEAARLKERAKQVERLLGLIAWARSEECVTT